MISLILLVSIQLINCRSVDNQSELKHIIKDHNILDNFVDLIEQNERQVHNGIASGRYDREDKQEDDDTDDDNYTAKMLMQDMANFRHVKVPGVDYDLEPVPIRIPMPVIEINEIDEEEDGAQEDSTPPPEEISSNVEPENQQNEYRPQPPPPHHKHQHRYKNQNQETEPNEGEPHRHHLNEDERQHRIDRRIGKNHGLKQNDHKLSHFVDFDRVRSNPLPPMTHSSYQDSAELHLMDEPKDANNEQINDQHLGRLPHSHPIDESVENEKPNDRLYPSRNDRNNPQNDEPFPSNRPNEPNRPIRHSHSEHTHFHIHDDPGSNNNQPNEEHNPSHNEPNLRETPQHPIEDQFDEPLLQKEPLNDRNPNEEQYHLNPNNREHHSHDDQDQPKSRSYGQRIGDHYHTHNEPNNPEDDPRHQSDPQYNEEHYHPHNEPNREEGNPHPNEGSEHYRSHTNTHNEPNRRDSHSHENEDHIHSNDRSVSEPNDYKRRKENYEISDPTVEGNPYLIPSAPYQPNNMEREEPIGVENPNYSQQPIGLDPNSMPLKLVIDLNSEPEPQPQPEPEPEPEPKQDDHDTHHHHNDHNIAQDEPPKPLEVGGNGDRIMKYYEDQSKIDSKRTTQLTDESPKQSSDGSNGELIKREDSQKFENYKNTNEPQIIGENKQINKRSLLLSSPNSPQNSPQNSPHNSPLQKGFYLPVNYENTPQHNDDGPTRGSREYSNSQEYHSYEPNTPMNEEEEPSDPLKNLYDQFADQHAKFSHKKFKPDDHLTDDPQYRKADQPKRDHNRDNPNQSHTHSGHSSRPLNSEDYESYRPTNDESLHHLEKPQPRDPHYSPHHHPRPNPRPRPDIDHNRYPHPHSDHHPTEHPTEHPTHPTESPQDHNTDEEVDEPEPHSHYHDDHSEKAEEGPSTYTRPHTMNRSPQKAQSSESDGEDYPPHSHPNPRSHNNAEPLPNRELGSRVGNNDYNKQNDKRSDPKSEDSYYSIFGKQGTAKLDSLNPRNLSGVIDNYQDYDNQNGQEMNENENPEQHRSEDESSNQSPLSPDIEDEQQEYVPQRKRQHSQHSAHNEPKKHIQPTERTPHTQHTQHSYSSDPSQIHKSDKTSMNAYNNHNNDYSQKDDYYRQNTNSRYGAPNHRSHNSMANQRHNEGYHNEDQHNQRNPNQYSEARNEEEPHIRPYHGRRPIPQQYYDEEKAATVDISTKKVNPNNTAVLLSDESNKLLIETNKSQITKPFLPSLPSILSLTPLSDNVNQTLAIKSIDSFSSWVKPLTLKTRPTVIGDKNDTKTSQKLYQLLSNTNTNRDEERVKDNKESERPVETQRKNTRNITRKPKIETKIREEKTEKTINSVYISNKNQTLDTIINPNNKSEYQLKPTNPKTIYQQMVRTIRTRPQRSITEDAIDSVRNSDHLNDNQLSLNYTNSWSQSLPNIWTHLINSSAENSITEPECAQSNEVKNFCLQLDEEYPLESIRENLIRNLENIRSVHRSLNSSVTNDRYYEDSNDSLDKSCEAQRLTIRPLRAKNINGEWKIIANIGDLLEQKITLTNCSEDNKDFETNGQKSITNCVQKYSLKDLITYNIESTDFEIDIFLVPTVCSRSSHKTNII